MKNLKKSFQVSFIFGTSILIGSGVGYSLISQQAQSYNDIHTQTTYEEDQTQIADDFVNDLNNLQTGETYILTSNIDLSYLSDPNSHVQLASGVTIEGNGYTVSNRTFNDQTTFELTSIENLQNTYFFNTEIVDSTINNLTFENFYFPIYGLNNSDLNNVNYINTDYSNLTFNLNSYVYYFDQNTTYNYYYEDIGLFINHMMNGSSFTNSTIQNITFSNNILNNQFPKATNRTFYLITVAPIARVIQPKTTEPTLNTISNIYVNDISYEGNSIVGEKMSLGYSYSNNYGDASSIYFSPLLTATQGYKDNNSWLQLDMNHIVFNDITFGGDNDASEVSAHYDDTGLDFGIYFSFYPSEPVNTIASYQDIFIFNSNIEGPDETNSTVYYTGYTNGLNNYTVSTRVQIIANNVFTYQQEQFSDYLMVGSDFLQSSSTLENMLSTILFYDSENGETDPSLGPDNEVTKSYFDSRYWTLDHQSLNEDPHLALISKPSATNLTLEDEGDNVKVSFTFRAGVVDDTINSWNLSLVDQNNVTFWNSIMSSGEVATFEISKETLFDPNNSFELQIASEDGSYVSNTQEFNSTYYLPKFENTSNLYNSTTQQIDLSFSVDDPYELLTTSSIALYEDDGTNDKLIESKSINPYSNVITSSNNKEIQTYIISTNSTFDIGTQDPKEYFSNYFFELDVNYSFKGQVYSIDDYYLNIDQENSDVRYGVHNESTQSYWYWILVLIFCIILILLTILITLLWFRKRNQNLDLAIRFEEVTGKSLF